MFNRPKRSEPRPIWASLGVFAFLGAALAAGHEPFEMPFVSAVALAVVFYLWPSIPRAALHGWVLGAGYFGVSLSWIAEPFFIDAAATGFLAIPAVVGMAVGMGLFWALAFGIAGRFSVNGIWLVIAWAGAEMLRSYVLTGFPWAMLSYVWIDTPVYWLAKFVGPHGVNLLFLLAAYGVSRLPVFRAMIFLGGAMFGILFLSQFAPLSPATAPADQRVVRIVHPDVLQSEKWHPATQAQMYQRHIELTTSETPVDLVVWPETALTLPLRLSGPEIAAAAKGAPVLLGYQWRNADFEYRNSAILLDAQGQLQTHYDKARLVPFGEYMPFASVLISLGLGEITGLVGAGFVAGQGAQVMEVPGFGTVQVLICYEGIFPQYVGSTSTRPDAIVLITNDGWFGTSHGPAQHFAQARARAIEQGIPVIRAANRGISAVIDPTGRVVQSHGIGQPIGFNVAVPKGGPVTLYSHFGDWMALLIAIFITVAFILWPHWRARAISG